MWCRLKNAAPNLSIAGIYNKELRRYCNKVEKLKQCTCICVADPGGVRIGSGGGTLNALDCLVKLIGAECLSNSIVAIIHSGGDSRRAPLHSICGKAWATINGTVDDNLIATPISLLIEELSLFCKNISMGSIVIACSDVLLDIYMDGISPIIPNDSVSVIVVPELPSIAKNHGVVVASSNSSLITDNLQPATNISNTIIPSHFQYQCRPVKRYLQKPSIEEMRSFRAIRTHASTTSSDTSSGDNIHTHDTALIDTGVIIITGLALQKYLELLDNPITNRCTARGINNNYNTQEQSESVSESVLRLELYSELLLPLTTEDGQCTLEEFYFRLGYSHKTHKDTVTSNSNSDNEAATTTTMTTMSHGAIPLYEQALSVIWELLKSIPLQHITVERGKFCHLGTSSEILELLTSSTSVSVSASNTLSDENEKKEYNNDRLLVPTSSTSTSINKEIDKVQISHDSNKEDKFEIFAKRYKLKRDFYNYSNSNNRSGSSDSNNANIDNHNDNDDNGSASNGVVINSYINHPVTVTGGGRGRKGVVCGRNCLVEHCVLPGNSDNNNGCCSIAEGAVASHIYGPVADNLTLLPGIMAQLIPLHPDNMKTFMTLNNCDNRHSGLHDTPLYVLLLLSVSDDVKAQYRSSKATVCGSPWNTLFQMTSTTADDIWPSTIPYEDRSLWTARLMSEWKRGMRLSLSDLLNSSGGLGDAGGMFRWRKQLQINGTKIHTSGYRIDIKMRNFIRSHLWIENIKIDDQSQNSSSLKDILIKVLEHQNKSNYIFIIDVFIRVWTTFIVMIRAGTTLTVDVNVFIPSQEFLQILVSHCTVNGIRNVLKHFLTYFADASHKIFHTSCSNNTNNTSSLLSREEEQQQQQALEKEVQLPRVFLCSEWLAGEGHMLASKGLEGFVENQLHSSIAYGNSSNGDSGDSNGDSGGSNGSDARGLVRGIVDRIFDNSSCRSSSNSNNSSSNSQAGSNNNSENSTRIGIESDSGSDSLGTLQSQFEYIMQCIVRSHVQQSLKISLQSFTPPTTASTPTPAGAGSTSRLLQDIISIARAPARLDIAGGWSDTPPICYQSLGGAVMNVAVRVEGQYPISCASRALPRPCVRLVSILRTAIDASTCSFATHPDSFKLVEEEIQLPCHFPVPLDPRGNCALLKACLVALGIVPSSPSNNTTTTTTTIGDKEDNHSSGLLDSSSSSIGLELVSYSALPPGSGLGGSSIIAATALRSLGELFRLTLSDETLVNLVSHVEQLLTTGGGWQDQRETSIDQIDISVLQMKSSLHFIILTLACTVKIITGHFVKVGSIYGGFKIGRSSPKLPLRISVQSLSCSQRLARAFNDRVRLIYTGTQRLAKNTLINALRGFALSPQGCGVIAGLIDKAERVSTLLEDFALRDENIVTDEDIHDIIDNMAEFNSKYWDLKKQLAEGSEPPDIALLLQAIESESLCSGMSLCGAGAGGYALVFLRREVSGLALETFINKIKTTTTTTDGDDVVKVQSVQHTKQIGIMSMLDISPHLCVQRVEIDFNGIIVERVVYSEDKPNIQSYL
eukprot:gene3485-6931_t